MTEKLDELLKYAEISWPIFPVNEDKEPLTMHGFYDASTSPEVITAWHKRWPDCNWAVRTGSREQGGAGVIVVDIDHHEGGPNGFETWEHLREENPGPIETVEVSTGGGGKHLYFAYPAGTADIRSKQDALGPGVDIKANGGYVLVPPSVTAKPYSYDLDPQNTPLANLNGWEAPVRREVQEPEKPLKSSEDTPSDILADVIQALGALNRERADNYQQWVEVGMSLFQLDDAGLTLWDNWSKQSEKYEQGACAKKWESFSPALNDASKISLGSLYHWAETDHATPYIRPAGAHPKPSQYEKALSTLGYQFSVNTMNDQLYVNGLVDIRTGVEKNHRLNDLFLARIMTQLRENNYRTKEIAIDTMYSMGLENQFHPVRDYLEGLKWDGHDHLGEVTALIVDKDSIFPALFRAWVVGAVQRILGARPGQQHPMLVLDGPQGIGKSRFVWWLGSPLPSFFCQGSIATDNKDYWILLCSRFVWEVEELGATFRKSDLESLKSFISCEIVNVRQPYGRFEITKPATASFIGTLNNTGGFLADPTGNRRFRACTICHIDWDYEKKIDVNQVWAQAVELFRNGETHLLTDADEKKSQELNGNYEVEDTLTYDILDLYRVDPEKVDEFVATAQIAHSLRVSGRATGSDQQLNQRIANCMLKLGCQQARKRINGVQMRAWLGVSLKVGPI